MLKATIVDLGELEPGTVDDRVAGQRRRPGRADDRVRPPAVTAADRRRGRTLPRLGARDGRRPASRRPRPYFAAVNLFDLVVVVLVVVAVLIGFTSGALPQIGGLARRVRGWRPRDRPACRGSSRLVDGVEPAPPGDRRARRDAASSSGSARRSARRSAGLAAIRLRGRRPRTGRPGARRLRRRRPGAPRRLADRRPPRRRSDAGPRDPGADLDRRPRPERRPAGPDRDRRRARPAARRHAACRTCSSGSSPLPAPPVAQPERPGGPGDRRAARSPSTVRVSARTCLFQSSGHRLRRGPRLRRHERPRRRRRDGRSGSSAGRRPPRRGRGLRRPGARRRPALGPGPRRRPLRLAAADPIAARDRRDARLSRTAARSRSSRPPSSGAYTAQGRDIYGEPAGQPADPRAAGGRSSRATAAGR